MIELIDFPVPKDAEELPSIIFEDFETGRRECGRFFRWRHKFYVTVSREMDFKHRQMWHLSITHKSKYADWLIVRDARYAFIPNDCTMALLLPPKKHGDLQEVNRLDLYEIMDER